MEKNNTKEVKAFRAEIAKWEDAGTFLSIVDSIEKQALTLKDGVKKHAETLKRKGWAAKDIGAFLSKAYRLVGGISAQTVSVALIEAGCRTRAKRSDTKVPVSQRTKAEQAELARKILTAAGFAPAAVRRMVAAL